MKNTLFTTIICVVFNATVISSFIFFIKIQKIALRHWDGKRDLFGVTIKEKLTDSERRMVKKYQRLWALSFICGALLMILLFFVQGVWKVF